MTIIIDYFTFVINKIIDILNSLKLPGGQSLLFYLLCAIIIGFIFRLVKGSSNEFEHSMNFSTGTLFQRGTAKYNQSNQARKQQIIKNSSFRDGMVSGIDKDGITDEF